MSIGKVVTAPSRPRIASFVSTEPVLFGKTLADWYWIAEGLSGAVLVYVGVKNIAGAGQWFGGYPELVGVAMFVAAIFRVSDLMEEETNIVMSALLIFLAGIIGGLTTSGVVTAAAETAKSITPEFSYNANIASVGGATTCEWWNNRQNRKLAGDEASWCASAVSSKSKGYQDCECK